MTSQPLSPIQTDDRQRVLNSFRNHTNPQAVTLTRRSFCTLSSISMLSFFLPSCSESNTSLKVLSQEVEFNQFMEIIFPAQDFGLTQYQQTALKRIQNLEQKYAEVIIQVYKMFKRRLWLKSDLGTKKHTKTMSEECLSGLLQSKHAELCNSALDIIYFVLSKDNQLMTTLWGKSFSLSDKKCIYWDNYDQALS